MKWLISIRGSMRLLHDGQIRHAHTLIGELAGENGNVGALMVAMSDAFLDDGMRIVFNPSRKVILEMSHVTSIVEMPDPSSDCQTHLVG